MRKITEILRLRWQCHASQAEIANSCGIGQSTVSEYLRRAKLANLAWPLPPDLTEEELDRRLFPPPVTVPATSRPLPDWAAVREKLRLKGMTLLLIWEEYDRQTPNAYHYSWFCRAYRDWEATACPRMRMVHLPGDKLFVDYAGHTVCVYDKATGEVREAQVYVATMGASNYTYAEATWTQSISDWIGSNTRALEFFGGVPRAIVPDNLKAGVKSANYYEPDLNKTFHEWARHYSVAILPARVRKPRDKAKVENGVQQVERRVLAALHGRTFFSLDELNIAIRDFLEQLNQRETRDLPASRKVMFETSEFAALSPLPSHRFEDAVWSKARVHVDYHIDVGRHFYSVHYNLIGAQVDVRLTAQTVEIFHNSQRVASHIRSPQKFRSTTLPEHRPANHAAALGATDKSLLLKAHSVGPNTAALLKKIMDSLEYPEEGYRRCQGILRLADERGRQAVESVCALAVQMNVTSYRRIKAMLDNMRQEPQTTEPPPVQHDNIRGSEYYQDDNAA
jgi:transposase